MKLKTVAAAVGVVVALTACGAVDSTTTSTASATTTTVGDATTTTAETGTTTAGSTTKVNANTATASEIAAALSTAGVSNADRWAREVLEYRPYDTSDPDLTHLRDELQKYNPGQDVIDQIVSVLEP